MIKINEAIIVEGKYDKIKLSNIVDALIIETNGFQVFKDKERLEFIRKLAREQGIIIITDSDHSGVQIRNYISQGIPKEKIKNIYIPQIEGKEKRKENPSKEGYLGVEGINDKTLIKLLEEVGVEPINKSSDEIIKSVDLFELGLSGSKNSKIKKAAFLKSLSLPNNISNNALLTYLNKHYSKQEFYNLVGEINYECV